MPALPSNPPYSLESTTFRFPGLAALAGRAPLGGRREVALATYVAARLVHDLLPRRGISQPARAERASLARTWLANIALPTAVRPALAKLVEASTGPTRDAATAVRNVIGVAEPFLSTTAHSELDQLAKSLDADLAAT